MDPEAGERGRHGTRSTDAPTKRSDAPNFVQVLHARARMCAWVKPSVVPCDVGVCDALAHVV